MSSESVCQVARSWVDVGSFQMRLVVRFMIFAASVRNILVYLSIPVLHSEFLNPLNAELNPIFHLLTLLGAHPILYVSRINFKRRVKSQFPFVDIIRNSPYSPRYLDKG
jgi:hypothetical protein